MPAANISADLKQTAVNSGDFHVRSFNTTASRDATASEGTIRTGDLAFVVADGFYYKYNGATFDIDSRLGSRAVVTDFAGRDALTGLQVGDEVFIQQIGRSQFVESTGPTVWRNDSAQGSSVLTSTGNVTLNFDIAGSDIDGDGSVGLPYATPTRLLLDINHGSIGRYLAEDLSGGSYECPGGVDIKGGSQQLEITFVGCRANPVINWPAPAPAVSLVAGKFGTDESTTSGYVAVITKGSHWIDDANTGDPFEHGAFGFVAAPGGVSPQLHMVNGAVFFGTVSAYEYDTIFTMNPTPGAFYAQAPGWGKISGNQTTILKATGIKFTTDSVAFQPQLCGMELSGCSLVGSGLGVATLDCVIQSCYSPSLVHQGIKGVSGIFDRLSARDGDFGYTRGIAGDGAAVTTISITGSTILTLANIDFEGAGVSRCVNINEGGELLVGGDISVSDAPTSFLEMTAQSYGTFIRVLGSIVGACAGVPWKLFGSNFATGIDSAGNGTLVPGVPGDDIETLDGVVGYAAITPPLLDSISGARVVS